MTKTSWRVFLWFRRVLSWGLAALLLYSFINHEEMSLVLERLAKLQYGQLTAGLFSYGAAVVVAPFLIMTALTIIFGRWFCGFICPLGALMESTHFIRTLIKKRRFTYLPNKLWRSIIPTIVLTLYWFGFTLPFSRLEPYSVFVSGFGPTMLAILVFAGWRGRGFCNSFCPTGFVLRLFSNSTVLGFKLSPSRCLDCGACQRVCETSAIDSNN
ncbi:MAG: 4Fe-4S binding protein, partial [Deltaproteobacteria bacterium]|nr:4Fe-4S binding protein [Deltaproteobacteria bacterium]